MQVRAGAHAAEEHHRVRRLYVHQRLRLVQRRVRGGQVAQHDVRDRQVVERPADLRPLLLFAPGLQRRLHQVDRALGARTPDRFRQPFVVLLQRPASERERQVGAQAQHHRLGREAARGAQALLEDLHGLGQPANVVEHDAQRVRDAHLQDRILGGARQHHGLAGHLERARGHAAADRDHAQRVEGERLSPYRAVDTEVRERFVGRRFGFREFLAQRIATRQRRERPDEPLAIAVAAHPLDRRAECGQRAGTVFLGCAVHARAGRHPTGLLVTFQPPPPGRRRPPRSPETAAGCRASPRAIHASLEDPAGLSPTVTFPLCLREAGPARAAPMQATGSEYSCRTARRRNKNGPARGPFGGRSARAQSRA